MQEKMTGQGAGPGAATGTQVRTQVRTQVWTQVRAAGGGGRPRALGTGGLHGDCVLPPEDSLLGAHTVQRAHCARTPAGVGW